MGDLRPLDQDDILDPMHDAEDIGDVERIHVARGCKNDTVAALAVGNDSVFAEDVHPLVCGEGYVGIKRIVASILPPMRGWIPAADGVLHGDARPAFLVRRAAVRVRHDSDKRTRY